MSDIEETNNFTNQQSDNSSQPRLRKIKRPKSHNGPIVDMPTASGYPSQTAQESSAGGLIRADANTNSPIGNYPNPTYMNGYPEQEVDDNPYVYQSGMEVFLAQMSPKKFIMILLLCFIFGLGFGKFLFSSKPVVLNGLQDVVVNPEVPQGRSRCGVVEKTQGCVLYVMNPQRQELNGRDFYDLASQLTGRQRFVIETGNMRYSSMKIKPGNIAQLNIPPLQ